MASFKPSCSRGYCLLLRNSKPCKLILRHLLAFLVIGHMITQNVVFCADQNDPEMSCYSCDQSGSEAGGENDDDLCINPNPASDENPSTTLECPESDNKCASIRLVHHYGGKVEVANVEVNVNEDKNEERQDEKHDQEETTDKEDIKTNQKYKRNPSDNKNGEDDNKKEPEGKNVSEERKEEEVENDKEDKKEQEEDDEGVRRKRRKRSNVGEVDTSFVEIARKGCSTEKRVKAALACFRNLFHHPYQRYLGKCTVTQFGREGFLEIKQKCEPGTLPKDMRVDMDRQDKFYLLLCTCEGDLCNDKELLELDKRVFIPEVKVVGNGTAWDEGWGRMGSGGAKDDDDNDEMMRRKFKSGGEMRKVACLLILVAFGVVISRGKF